MQKILQLNLNQDDSLDVTENQKSRLRSLLGDADNADLISKEEARAEMEARWQAKVAKHDKTLEERDAMIKANRDALNAAHRRAIQKIKKDARERVEALQARIAELEAEPQREP